MLQPPQGQQADQAYLVGLFAAMRTTRERTACPVLALMMMTLGRSGCCGFAAVMVDSLAGLVG